MYLIMDIYGRCQICIILRLVCRRGTRLAKPLKLSTTLVISKRIHSMMTLRPSARANAKKDSNDKENMPKTDIGEANTLPNRHGSIRIHVAACLRCHML